MSVPLWQVMPLPTSLPSTEAPGLQQARHPVSPGLRVVFGLLAIYLLSYGGTFRVDDEHILAARSQSLALWGVLDQPQVYGNDRVRALIPMGSQATAIEPLQTLIGAGLYRTAVALGLGGSQSLLAINLYITALIAGLVYATVRAIGYGPNTAAWCAWAFGLGGMAWPYATTFFRDPLVTFFTALSFLGWAHLLNPREPRMRARGAILFFTGIAGGILAKNVALAFVLGFGVSALVEMGRRRHPRIFSLRAVGLAMVLGIFLLMALQEIPAQGALARYSLSYYGGLARHFLASISPALLLSVIGAYLSPAKGLLLFCPPLVLAVYAAVRWWSSIRRFALPALLGSLLVALAQALFYRDQWAGSVTWGPRFMLPALPALICVSAPAIDALSRAARRWARAIPSLLLALGAVVAWSGAWVPWGLVYQAWVEKGWHPYTSAAAWDPRFLAVPGQIALLASPGIWSVAWARLLRDAPWSAGAILLAAFGMSIAVPRLLATRPRAIPEAWQHLAKSIVLGLGVLGSAIVLLLAVRSDPAMGGDRVEFREAAEAVGRAARPGDVVVVDAYGTPLWTYLMNWWEGPLLWYSLPYEIPGTANAPTNPGAWPSEATLELFGELDGVNERLWYLTTQENPDHALRRETTWLSEKHRLEQVERFHGETEVEVWRFDLGGGG